MFKAELCTLDPLLLVLLNFTHSTLGRCKINTQNSLAAVLSRTFLHVTQKCVSLFNGWCIATALHNAFKATISRSLILAQNGFLRHPFLEKIRCDYEFLSSHPSSMSVLCTLQFDLPQLAQIQIRWSKAFVPHALSHSSTHVCIMNVLVLLHYPLN